MNYPVRDLGTVTVTYRRSVVVELLDESVALRKFKVIPHICIAHPCCAKFMASLARARARAH